MTNRYLVLPIAIYDIQIFQVSIEEFLSKTPEPPSPAVIKSSVKTLKTIEALDSEENVTILGQHLLEMPLEP